MFLHEHPAQATSWDLIEIRKMAIREGVTVTVADQCMYGLKTWSENKKRYDTPARKRTKFMTNSPCIAEELSKRCKGKHVHQPLVDGRAKNAAIYPEPLCRAICVGLIRELENKVRQIRCLMSVKHSDKIRNEDVEERDGKRKRKGVQHLEDEEEGQMAWDDLTGEELPAQEVRKARLKEVGYIEDKKVWRKMPRKEAIRRGIKVVDVRWIDINKGDTKNPLYRSRLVAKEFNDGKDDSLYAGTPTTRSIKDASE